MILTVAAEQIHADVFTCIRVLMLLGITRSSKCVTRDTGEQKVLISFLPQYIMNV